MVVELSDGSPVDNLFELPCSVLDVVVVFEFGDVCVVVGCFVVDLVEGADGSTLVVVFIIVGGTSLVVGSFVVEDEIRSSPSVAPFCWFFFIS